MKKVISLLLALALCLSLCACGGGNEAPETKASSEPTPTTPPTTETTAPVETEPQYETVEITIDNWQDYFIIQPWSDIEYDVFGDVVKSKSGVGIFLRDEYVERLSDIHVDFKVCAPIEYWEIDPNSEEIIGTEPVYRDRWASLVPKESEKTTSVKMHQNTTQEEVSTAYVATLICSENISDETGHYQGVFSIDLEILKVQGTIVFYE